MGPQRGNRWLGMIRLLEIYLGLHWPASDLADLKSGAPPVVADTWRANGPFGANPAPSQPLVSGESRVIPILIKQNDRARTAVLKHVLKDCTGRRIKVAIDVQYGDASAPAAEE